jgi:DnaJ-class molecular chaperone
MVGYANTELKLCDACHGYGHTIEHELTNYHKGEYNTVTKKCRRCEGTGRIIETTETTWKPYVPHPTD